MQLYSLLPSPLDPSLPHSLPLDPSFLSSSLPLFLTPSLPRSLSSSLPPSLPPSLPLGPSFLSSCSLPPSLPPSLLIPRSSLPRSLFFHLCTMYVHAQRISGQWLLKLQKCLILVTANFSLFYQSGTVIILNMLCVKFPPEN